MLAPTSVCCLRRQFKIQNRQKISPAKCWKTFLPLGSLNQATAGTDIYQWQHRDGRGRGTSPDCKAQPPPWWWLVTRSDKLCYQTICVLCTPPSQAQLFLHHSWTHTAASLGEGKGASSLWAPDSFKISHWAEQQHSTPARNWYSSLSFYCLYFSTRTIILILWLKDYF